MARARFHWQIPAGYKTLPMAPTNFEDDEVLRSYLELDSSDNQHFKNLTSLLKFHLAHQTQFEKPRQNLKLLIINFNTL